MYDKLFSSSGPPQIWSAFLRILRLFATTVYLISKQETNAKLYAKLFQLTYTLMHWTYLHLNVIFFLLSNKSCTVSVYSWCLSLVRSPDYIRSLLRTWTQRMVVGHHPQSQPITADWGQSHWERQSQQYRRPMRSKSTCSMHSSSIRSKTHVHQQSCRWRSNHHTSTILVGIWQAAIK